MNIKEMIERREMEELSPLAAKSAQSRGRDHPIKPCELRSEFQRDRDRIIHSKSFRRLQFKTQVFVAPEGDHYRTRLTHTLEVSQVARSIARGLRLNEDLTEAIALGHDLGHTPFGHIGERTMNRLIGGGFRHNEQSLRVVEVLEGKGGLNLTWEVRDGILNHSGNGRAATLEGRVVGKADRIAYINHDIDDALRAGIIRPHELPPDALKILGKTHGERIEAMISDIVSESEKAGDIISSDLVQSATDMLRSFLFKNVYQDRWRTQEENKCDFIVSNLFRYFMEHPAEMPLEYVTIAYREGSERAVVDYVASMTDRFAARLFQKLFVPESFSVM
ncbi:MAG: deoxyguanosinetriphosphate triphosphohydrolase [Clostridia bacterium]|jgi:dGTPase|nr:deoxyguanosinetriphosphate triphosphohydrolase [Clostridia bacterium]